jgi:hypothetical protein
MLIKKATKFYVVAKDGTSLMTFNEIALACNGGMILDEVEVTTDDRRPSPTVRSETSSPPMEQNG